MPVISANPQTTAKANESGLRDADGSLTIEGQILEEFAGMLDYSALFEDAAIRPLVTTTRGFAKEVNGYLVACGEHDTGAKAVLIESIPGALAGKCIDKKDARSGLGYFLMTCIPEDTLTNRTIKEMASSLVEATDMDGLDKFSKSAYARLHRAGGLGAAKVDAMMEETLADILIRRAKTTTRPVPGTHEGQWKRYTVRESAVMTRMPSRWRGNAPAINSIRAAVGANKNESITAYLSNQPTSPLPESVRSSRFESPNPVKMAARLVTEANRRM